MPDIPQSIQLTGSRHLTPLPSFCSESLLTPSAGKTLLRVLSLRKPSM